MSRSLVALGLSCSQWLIAAVGGHSLTLLAEARDSQQATTEIQQLATEGRVTQQKAHAQTIADLMKHGKAFQQNPSAEKEMAELVLQGREAVRKGVHHEKIQEVVERGKAILHTNPLKEESWLQRDIWGKETAPEKREVEADILIFASLSLGKQGLDELLEGAARYPNAVVVFRGIPEGMTLGEGVKKIQEMAAKKNPVPNVVINPPLFEKYEVADVPTVVLLAAKEGRLADEWPVIASVKGLSDPVWLLGKVSQGKRGDQGVQGNIVPIKEPDLIKLMQTRVMAIDWEEKKRVALARCWKNLPTHRLPTVTKSCTRVIDPTVVVTKDMIAPSGAIIAQAGTKVNPLAMRPFTQVVAVFDPLDKTHIALVQKALPSIKKQSGTQRVTYIATQFCADKGWEGYKEISDAVNAPVYLLTPDIVERFELQRAPSIIHANRNHFLVEELADAQ